MSELETLKSVASQVRRWLVLLSNESLDAHTLGVVHACVHALDFGSPKLRPARGPVGGSKWVDGLAQKMVQEITLAKADLAYALAFRKAAEMLEERRWTSRIGLKTAAGLSEPSLLQALREDWGA